MSNLLSQAEVDALRTDLNRLIGIEPDGDESKAKCTAKITRTTDIGTFNEVTLEYENPTILDIYGGPCLIGPIVFRRDRTEMIGQEQIRVRTYRAVLPHDTNTVKILDDFEVLTSTDAGLVGRPMSVVDIMYSTEQGARRITLQDIGDD